MLTFLERLSHHALPKNRKRETLDACIELNENYTLLKNNKEHFWFQKSCKLGEYHILQVNDCIICQNNRRADVHVCTC